MIEDLPEKFCFQPPYNGRNFTNRVLYEDKIEMAKKRITYYCPAYMRIKIKNFTELNHQDLQAGINVNIILTINCRGIKPLIEAKIKEMLRISFNRDDSVKVEQNSHNIKPECDGVYSFVIAMNVHVAMNPDVFISPFEILNLLMSISIQDIQINEEIIKEVKENAKLQIKRLKIQNELDFHSEQKIGEEVEGEGTENNDNISNDYIIQKLNEEIQQLNKISAFYVRFNLMDTNASRLKMNYTSQGTFGNYDLVQSGLSVEYTNHSVNKSVRLKKKNNFSREEEAKNADYSLIRPFKHAHFEIPIYKFPMVTIATIFIPLWLLGIITVGIYFQDTVLVDRIVSISALLIAFVQIISVIREQLPPSPSVSLLQILVYAQIIGTCMLCLLESIQMEIGPIDYNFIWYQSWSFITSCIVLLVQFIVILVLIIVHKFVWQPRYNREPTSFKLGSFDYKKWQNNECQKHFHRKIDSKLIKILKVQNEFEKIKDYLISLTQQQKQEIAQKLKNESGNESKLQFLRIIVQNLGS